MFGVFCLLVFIHGQEIVDNGGGGDDDKDSKNTDDAPVNIRELSDDNDDESVSKSVGEPLNRRALFNVRKLFQKRQSSGFTANQRKYQQLALEAHNGHRARHCVPPLQLDDSISRSAQNYAEYLASINSLVHSGKSGLGENLYMESSSNGIKNIYGNTATDAWYKEIKDYSFNWPSFSMGTGHFTQVVWKGSKKLGVGYAITKDGRSLYVVAQYSPPGNYQGQYGQNVLQAKC